MMLRYLKIKGDFIMKYLSCKYMEHGMDFEHRRLDTCCFTSHKGGGHVIYKKPYNGEAIDWDDFFAFKKTFRENHRNGRLTPNCEGCIFLEEKEWDEENYIDYIQFNYWINCNSRCSYCFIMQHPEIFNDMSAYNSVPIIREMLEKKILRPGGEISFGGGEPTIHPEFDELIDLLTDNGFTAMRIHSSGIKYSPAIAKSISKGAMNVVISIDAGSKEIYEKIKRVPCYEKVLDTMKKYVEADVLKKHAVISKYIILPDINDNYDEIENWIQSVVNVGVSALAIDIEDIWYTESREHVSPYYLDLVNYVQRRAEELDLYFELYDRAKGLKRFYENYRG